MKYIQYLAIIRLRQLQVAVNYLQRTVFSKLWTLNSILVTVYCLLSTVYSNAQTLPVNAQVVVTPPYANSLNDYGTGSNLMLNLLLRDMNTPMLEVYFAIELEGSAIKLKTSPAFRPSTYADLSPGVMTTLSNSDLLEYFDLKNLELEGMSKSDFAANSSLFPEGLYKFKIQAFSRNTGFAVSNTAQALMGIFKGQAPFINLPFNKGVVRVNDLQNFSIQWTNRNSASFSASNSTGYKLEMWEMLDPSQDPNIIVNSAYPPILSHYTALTTYLYGPSDYALVPGKRYALRVQALDADGRDIYQNGGYSQVSSFTYGEVCMTPTDVKAVASQDQILFTWTGTAGTGGFQVKYQMANGAFEEKTVYMNKYILKPVVPNAEYLFQVATLCDGGRASDYSTAISTRSQPTGNNNQAKCGDPLPKVDLKNTKLIPELKLGDVFKAYDFEIKVTRIDNNDNTKYAGEGTTQVKMLGNLNIVVNFKDVKINTDYQMLEGRVDLQQEPYVLSDESVKDFLDDAQETKKRATGNDDANADNITVDAVIGSVTYNETTKQIEVKDASGTVIKKLTAGKNYSIKDKDGNQYLVSEDNKITKVPPKGATATSKGTAPKIQGGENTDMSFGDNQPIIIFVPASDQVYAFDTKELKTNSESQYEYIVGPSKSYYYVPCKSIAAAGADKVVAKLQVNPTSVDLSKIKFKDHEGKVYNASANSTNTEWTVDLVGALHGHEYALFPYYTDATGTDVLCGKLNVFSFDQFSVKIKFIPLKGHQPSGFDKDNLQSYLNKVYQQANINFELSVEASFDTTTTSLSVDHGKLMDYSSAQVDLINAYITKNGEAEDNTLYLFMCKETSSSNVKGHTPVNRSYGFLFGNADDRTIAHEIAHGYPLALEHPFSDIGHSTDYNNLLSYNTSTSLSFKQWLLAHNPPLKIRFGINQKEAESRRSADNSAFVAEILDKIKGSKNYNIDYLNNLNNKYITIDLVALCRKYEIENSTVIAKNMEFNRVNFDKITIGGVNGLNASITIFENSIRKTIVKLSENNISNVLGIYNYNRTSRSYDSNPTLLITGYDALYTNFQTENDKTKKGQEFLYDYLNSINSTLSVEYGRLTLFVNGYRNNMDFTDIWRALKEYNSLLSEHKNTTNDVYHNIDFTNYWGEIDDKFSERLTKKFYTYNAVYADGHMDLTTSNHVAKDGLVSSSKIKFFAGLITSSCAQPDNSVGEGARSFYSEYKSCLSANVILKSKLKCGAIVATYNALPAPLKTALATCEGPVGDESKVVLDEEPNVAGYNKRFAEGRKAGQNLITKMRNYEIPIGNNKSVTIDVVAHSMGFAYSMGMIDFLKGQKDINVSFGRFYILAPENACSGVDVTKLGFEEVWQYGSDTRTGKDKKYEQDGIAPQCAAKGLDWDHGRVPFQGAQELKNFLDAHYSSSYGWIFDNLKKGAQGYVGQR